MPTGTEQEKVVQLVGSPANPAREPRKRPPTGKGSIGDTAFMDSVVIVALCWVALILLMFSLRSHNI
jgi:hypothetical protein